MFRVIFLKSKAARAYCLRSYCTKTYRPVPANIEKPSYANNSVKPTRTSVNNNQIEIKTASQINGMRCAGALARKVLGVLENNIQPGVTTNELDKIAHDMIISNNAYPSPLLYRGYPKSICTSVNNVACHGIPNDKPLKNGDIISVDVTVYFGGFHGDCASTFLVGDVDEESRKLVKAAKLCRDEGINVCKPGQKFSAIGNKISWVAKSMNLKIIPHFCGHGIGSYFHGPPDIYHFSNRFPGTMLEGMTFTIEPVVSENTEDTVILADGWTAITTDNSRAAQFEHTILITSNGFDILA